jgi:hypothetical protein
MAVPSPNIPSSSRYASGPLTEPETARIAVVTEIVPPMERSMPRVNRFRVWAKATMASGNTAENRTSTAPGPSIRAGSIARMATPSTAT